ncbi:erythromycin esterase family protein [Mangrovibacterium marinum]|uniref:erythromycin esterase family protein n=1 Tax=Mangrovibacterium marinum TaxID=1639118 RepID=UPI002A1887E2|nr:erythromycin esterase family protein [Mangrovibacterium marinum]
MMRKDQEKPFNACIFQIIPLPISPQKIEVSVYSKTSDVEEAWLKLYGLDRCDKITSRDSIPLISNGEWIKFTLKSKGFNTQRVYIEISATSSKIIPIDLDKIIERVKSGKEMSESVISIDNMFLELNDRDVSQYDCSNSDSSNIFANRINEDISLATISVENLANLDEFKNHSIIAFGESVHGSREIQGITLNAISDLIKKDNCKLILFEFPFELGLRINEFILGKKEEDISKLLVFNNLDVPSFVEFFNWLKIFNIDQKNKITVMGIDENKEFKIEDDLNIFISDSYPNDSLMNKLSCLIDRKEFKEALFITQTQFAIDSTDYKLKCIMNAIKLRTRMASIVSPFHEDKREFTMFQNSKFAIETFINGTEKTAIFAHHGHIDKQNNKGNRINAKNLGGYLFQTYSDNYFSIAILVGNGIITSFGKNGFESDFHLQTPPVGSIENLCLKLNKEAFYVDSKKLPPINLGRFIGAFYTNNQFCSCLSCDSFDGLLFIKNSTGNRLPSDWPKSKIDIQKFLRYKNIVSQKK